MSEQGDYLKVFKAGIKSETKKKITKRKTACNIASNQKKTSQRNKNLKKKKTGKKQLTGNLESALMEDVEEEDSNEELELSFRQTQDSS